MSLLELSWVLGRFFGFFLGNYSLQPFFSLKATLFPRNVTFPLIKVVYILHKCYALKLSFLKMPKSKEDDTVLVKTFFINRMSLKAF